MIFYFNIREKLSNTMLYMIFQYGRVGLVFLPFAFSQIPELTHSLKVLLKTRMTTYMRREAQNNDGIIKRTECKVSSKLVAIIKQIKKEIMLKENHETF